MNLVKINTLEHLLFPVGIAAFAQDFWEQKHIHVARNDPSYYAHIMTREDLDEYLSRNDIRYPSLRMIRAGKPVPLSDFSRPLRFELEANLAECDFLTGNLAEADKRLSDLSGRAANLKDKAWIARLRMPLYTTLDRLDDKGLIRWRTVPGTEARDGLPRRLYSVTAAGVAAIRSAREVVHKLWDGLDTHLIDQKP